MLILFPSATIGTTEEGAPPLGVGMGLLAVILLIFLILVIFFLLALSRRHARKRGMRLEGEPPPLLDAWREAGRRVHPEGADGEINDDD